MTTQKQQTEKLEAYLAKFNNDATTWREATDELRDLTYRARCAYNELTLDVLPGDEGYYESLNWSEIAKLGPAAWNMTAKREIRTLWNLMNEWSREYTIKEL